MEEELSNSNFSQYFTYFHEIVPEGELLSGSRVREFFRLSNLPIDTLEHIWNLSDVDDDGQLNAVEFAIALHLTQLALGGVSLPSSLPSNLRSLVQKVTNPKEYLPVAKSNQLEMCMSAFLSYCENTNNEMGFLSIQASRYILVNSRLSKAHLYHIWKLSDIDKDGRLTFQEFSVAMHLIFVAKLDQPLPLQVQPAEILPTEFSSFAKKVEAMVAEKPPVPAEDNLPLVPLFAIPTDYPAIHPLIKAIPPDKFKEGKFDSFTGNPFKSIQVNGSGNQHSNSLDELSTTGSRHSSESADISQLSSSRHSSVRSLVEEHDSPRLQQVKSVGIHKPTEKTTEDDSDSEEEEEDMARNERFEEELAHISEASEKFLSETGSKLPPSPRAVPMESQAFTKSAEMQTAATKGLSTTISEIVPAEANTSTPTPDSGTDTTSTEEPSHSEAIEGSKEDTTTATPPGQKPTDSSQQSNGNILAELDNLEAEIMNVLEDTNSVDFQNVQVDPSKSPRRFTFSDGSSSSPSHLPPKVKTLPRAQTAKSPTTPTKTAKTAPKVDLTSSKKSDATKLHPESNISSPWRSTIGESPRRKVVNRKSILLDELDDLFSEEIASIENIMEERNAQQKKSEEWQKREREEFKKAEKRISAEIKETVPINVKSMEEIAREREAESLRKQQEWENELKTVEAEAKQKYYEQMEKVELLGDETIQSLEQEFEAMLEHEAENMKGAWDIRAQKKKEEEERRKEEMRKAMESRNKITVEEWIAMMEKNKLDQMTPEEREKYMERKKIFLEQRRQKEEKRRKEMEEKLEKNRRQMANEYYFMRHVEEEVKDSRLTSEALNQLVEQQKQSEVEERKIRAEQARQRTEARIRLDSESKTAARSVLAQKWENQVKHRDTKDVRSTVLTTTDSRIQNSAGRREEERLARRVGSIGRK